jgi:hypothetical protein
MAGGQNMVLAAFLSFGSLVAAWIFVPTRKSTPQD